jgi:hypothetical protein
MSPHFDLFMVTKNGLDFYKLNRKTHKLAHVIGFTQSAAHYWYFQGVLIIAASGPKLGKCYSFFLDKEPKSLPGPRFYIDLTYAAGEDWIVRPVNASRIAEPHEPSSTMHRILLCKLYGDTVLVHITSAQCRMTLYFVYEDSIDIKDNFDPMPPGKYDIHCVDNVLLAMNLTLHETYLYDIKSSKYATRPFSTIWNGIKPGPSQLVVKIEVQEEASGLVIQPLILYDGKLLAEDSASITTARRPNEHIFETSLDINPKLVSLGPEHLLDIEAGRCYRLTLDVNEAIREHPDRLESILFLFRRDGYRVLGFNCLRQALRSRISLAVLSSFFDTINLVCKLSNRKSQSRLAQSTLLEGDQRRLSASFQGLTRRSSLSGPVREMYREEVKTDSGMTVLLQSDLVGSIFLPLFDDQSVEPLYFASVIIEYIRSLINQEIPVYLSLQMMLARLALRSQSFMLLQELLLFGILSDSRDLAQLLLAFSRSEAGSQLFRQAFQLSIDMLSRLKLYDEVADVMLSRGSVYEVVLLASSPSSPMFDLAKLQQEAAHYDDPELIDSMEVYTKYLSSE